MVLFRRLIRLAIFVCALTTLHPVVTSGLQLDDSLLEHLLIFNQLLHFKVAVFARIVFEYLQAFSQVFVLVLKLVNFLILLVNQLRLLLDRLAEAQISLQNFFHHVDCLDDAASNSVF